MKLNISKALDWLKFPSYIALLVADIAVVFLSFQSVEYDPLYKYILSGVGCILVMVSAMAFLRGIRSIGVEKWVCLIVWGFVVVLIVSVNWAFITVSTRSQTETTITIKQDNDFIKKIRQDQISEKQESIKLLNLKLKDVSAWRPNDLKLIDEAIKAANNELTELLKPEKAKDEKQTITAHDVFEKMSLLTGGNVDLATNIWWLLLFVCIQTLTVIAAPKSDDKPTRKRRERERKPKRDTSMSELVKWWVSTNWMGVRTGKSTKILPREAFDKFTTERFPQFPLDRYDEILQAAMRIQAIDGDEIREADEATAVKRILASMGKKKEDQPELF